MHDLGAVGHRVVQGDESFFDSALITDDVVDGIEACVDLAPPHDPANLAGIRAAMASLPDLPHVAVFDTAFHRRMSARARTYAIRRYGFDGTSHALIGSKNWGVFLRIPVSVGICHLCCRQSHSHLSNSA